MSSPATAIDAGSELGFHRGGFSAIDFDSLMVVDMGRLTVMDQYVEGGARGALLRDHETRNSPSRTLVVSSTTVRPQPQTVLS